MIRAAVVVNVVVVENDNEERILLFRRGSGLLVQYNKRTAPRSGGEKNAREKEAQRILERS
jgi:hypothetical protein